MKPITEKQKAILDFIIKFKNENEMPPTYREIAEGRGVTIKSIWDHVSALARKGYISRQDKISRGLKVLKND